MRRISRLVLVALLLLATAASAQAQQAPPCAGLDTVEIALFTIGQRWLDRTQRAGVNYTADPASFDSANWATFSALATQKAIDLAAIEPPLWLDPWLSTQIDAATLQSAAAAAATHDGIGALADFQDRFAMLLEAVETETSAAVTQCAGFAPVAATWASLNRDFQPAATPVAT